MQKEGTAELLVTKLGKTSEETEVERILDINCFFAAVNVSVNK
jgi:hypothetical protein